MCVVFLIEISLYLRTLRVGLSHRVFRDRPVLDYIIAMAAGPGGVDAPPLPLLHIQGRPGRVLILGHSYIRRLESYCSGLGRVNMGINPDQASVSFHGIGGARVAALWDELGRISRVKPDVLTLQIGGNDLSGRSSESVAEDILQFLEYLEGHFHIQHVFLCQLLPRISGGVRYNQHLVPHTNMILEQRLNVERRIPGTRFWYHAKGLNSIRPILYTSDGVHLSHHGMRKYYKSIRGTVMSILH